MGRAPCCDKANVKKGPWSPEEDAKLKEYIDKYGTGGNWIALPQKAGLKRCGKSCRLRWLNYLRPNIKHGEFSDEEDRIICSLYASIGSRWSIIAAQLPGRTDNDIKNYWNTKLKKKLMLANNMNNNINNNMMKNNLNNNNTTFSTTFNNIYQKKSHDHMLASMSLATSLFSQAISNTSPSNYQCTSTTCYNNPPLINSTTLFDLPTQQISPSSNSNNSTVLQSSALTMHHQQQPQGKDNTALLMFSGQQQQPSCSSSDGSQAMIKCEEQSYGINYQHDQDKKTNIKSNNSGDQMWGQCSQSNSVLLEQYGLEEIKELISTNITVGNYFDETSKAPAVVLEEDNNSKMMYYYY